MTATILPAPSRRALPLPGATSALWPAMTIVLALVLQLAITTTRAINWDEFFHYAQVHQFLAGTLDKPLQSLSARLFSWAALLPGTGVDHILAIRLAEFAFLATAAAAIYAIARRFAPAPIAQLAVLLYLSGGFVLQHGSSFRADAVAAAMLTTSLAAMLRLRLSPRVILLAAALAAAALLMTIKSVLYAPAFAGIAWLRWQEAGRSRDATLRLGGLAVAVAVLFGLMFLAHSAGLASGADGKAEAMAANSAGKMFALTGLPYYNHILQGALLAPVLAICVLLVPVLLWRDKGSVAGRVALAGLWLPMLSVAVYHNTAPYFYTFILPPVCAACAVALPLLVKRYSVAALSAILAVNALTIWLIEPESPLGKQRQLLQAADLMWPEKPAYFDFPAMLGSFPKANTFMTPWGVDNYLKGVTPPMVEAMARQPVPLVVENDPMFSAALRSAGPVPQFLPADLAAIRSSYIHFWGPFWVAGQELRGGETRRVQILVPGIHTVEGAGLRVDGKSVAAGSTIALSRRSYEFSADSGTARLVWGNRPARPAFAPPAPPYWTDF
ncbi:MAG: hypothetical protein WA842_15440 [Croceibacterium sp.]